eukprot:gene3364-5911_t
MEIPPPDNLYSKSHKRKREDDIEQPSVLNLPKFQEQPKESLLTSKPKPKKISRWSNVKVYLPGHPLLLPWGLNEEALNASLIRGRLDEINNRLSSEIIVDDSERRSPSPEPIYDSRGVKSNTRDQRIKQRLQKERQQLIKEAQELHPMFTVPEYHPEPKKVTQKIWIPMDKNPDYNFIGLIIGPRGKTQRQMEMECRAKIAIRGKGSIKPKPGFETFRKYGKSIPGEDEDLHVLVTSDNDKSLHMANQMILKLLIPIEEGKNELKREQLRDLARIHGTLRDEDPNRPTTSVLDQKPLMENLENYGKKNVYLNKYVSTIDLGDQNQPAFAKDDEDYESFKSSLQMNTTSQQKTEEEILSQLDSQHYLSTIFSPSALMMQPIVPGISENDHVIDNNVPPILPGIFNLIPSLPIVPGLPDNYPWKKN